MSIHERVYEGTLAWPLALDRFGITCRAPAGKSLPPWGLSEEDPEVPEDCCAANFIGSSYLTLGEIREAIEEHMREAHGEQV